ncbi:hypothetical protein ACFXTI_039881 [Malus domestica]
MSVLVKCVKLAGSTNHVLLIENNPAETSHVTVGDLQEVVLGCSATIASKYLKTNFSNSAEINAVKENMTYFLLQAAIRDISTGGNPLQPEEGSMPYSLSPRLSSRYLKILSSNTY